MEKTSIEKALDLLRKHEVLECLDHNGKSGSQLADRIEEAIEKLYVPRPLDTSGEPVSIGKEYWYGELESCLICLDGTARLDFPNLLQPVHLNPGERVREIKAPPSYTQEDLEDWIYSQAEFCADHPSKEYIAWALREAAIRQQRVDDGKNEDA